MLSEDNCINNFLKRNGNVTKRTEPILHLQMMLSQLGNVNLDHI